MDPHLRKMIMEGDVQGSLSRGGAMMKKKKSASKKKVVKSGSKKMTKKKVSGGAKKKMAGSKKLVKKRVSMKKMVGAVMKRPDMVGGKFTSIAAKRRAIKALKMEHKKQMAMLKKIAIEKKTKKK